jgi:hypothetical protein
MKTTIMLGTCVALLLGSTAYAAPVVPGPGPVTPLLSDWPACPAGFTQSNVHGDSKTGFAYWTCTIIVGCPAGHYSPQIRMADVKSQHSTRVFAGRNNSANTELSYRCTYDRGLL